MTLPYLLIAVGVGALAGIVTYFMTRPSAEVLQNQNRPNPPPYKDRHQMCVDCYLPCDDDVYAACCNSPIHKVCKKRMTSMNINKCSKCSLNCKYSQK